MLCICVGVYNFPQVWLKSTELVGNSICHTAKN